MSWGPHHRDPHRAAPFAPPTVDPFRTRKPSCKSCGADLIFVEMEKSGKPMPCDTMQVYGDGRRSLVIRYPRGGPGQRGRQIVGRVIVKAGDEVLGLEPHFGTCPVQKRARKIAASSKRKVADPASPQERVDRILELVEVPDQK